MSRIWDTPAPLGWPHPGLGVRRLFDPSRPWSGQAPGAARTVLLGLIGGALAYGVIRLALYAVQWDAMLNVVGFDYGFVMGQAERIRAGGPWYQPWELTNPILPGQLADLYPPATVVLLFLPFSFLPAIAWWVIPLLTIGTVVAWHRPSALGWAMISGLFIVWPHTWTAIQLGNTVMWIAAAAALGTVARWPAVFVLLKPSLGPFALIGIRSRAWWLGALALLLLSLVLWPQALDYLRVVHNFRGDWTYSMHDVALVLIPIVAWLTGRQRSGAEPTVG